MTQTPLAWCPLRDHEPTLISRGALGTLQRSRKDPACCLLAILDQLRRPDSISFFSTLNLVNRLDAAEESP